MASEIPAEEKLFIGRIRPIPEIRSSSYIVPKNEIAPNPDSKSYSVTPFEIFPIIIKQFTVINVTGVEEQGSPDTSKSDGTERKFNP